MMCVKSWKWAIINGVLLWLIPFLAAFPIFPMKDNNPFLFHSILGIVAVTTCIILILHYFKKTGENSVKEGFYLGSIWLAINLALDLPIFLLIFQMPIGSYFSEIGLGYILYPVLTTGFSLATKSKL